MDWLTDSDQAMCALALRLADEIETAVNRAAEFDAIYQQAVDEDRYDIDQRLKRLVKLCNAVAAVDSLGPKLQAALTALGGTPATRRALAPQLPEIGGTLAQLRRSVGNNVTGARPR